MPATPIEQLAKVLNTLSSRVRRLESQVYVTRTYACRVTNSVAFSHSSSGNNLVVTFDTERWDTANMHSTSLNTGRIYAPINGWYHISASANFAANATGLRRLRLRRSGTTFIASVGVLPDAASTVMLSLSTIYYFSANDYVELLAFQNSGGNLDVIKEDENTPEFSVIRLGS